MTDREALNAQLDTAQAALALVHERLNAASRELETRSAETNRLTADLLNVLMSVDIAIVILDMKQRVRRVSPRARSALGLSPSDIGRPFAELRASTWLPDIDALVNDVLANRAIEEHELQDREGRWYRMQIRPYSTLDGGIDGAVVSLIDIDALKREISRSRLAQVQAERQSGSHASLLSSISHALRPPISVVRLQLEALRRCEQEGGEPGPLIERIEQAALRQTTLLDQLADAERLLDGTFDLPLQPFISRQYVRDAVQRFEAKAAALGIRLEVDLAEETPPTWGDPERFGQAVSSLLLNALEVTPRGGLISVRLRCADGVASLNVADTGVGIEASLLPHMFELPGPRQGGGPSGRNGIGVALAIVRHVMKSSGGSVSVQSEGIGRGACFTLTWPLVSFERHEPDPVHLNQSFAGRPLDRPGRRQQYDELRGLRVLVVDDDDETRAAVVEILRLSGVDVCAAASAAEAGRVFMEFLPQLLVCDIMMPGEDGNAFMRRIRTRSSEHGGEIPALALSGRTSDVDRQRALDAGFQRYLAKPVDVDLLRRELVALLSDAGAHARPRAWIE